MRTATLICFLLAGPMALAADLRQPIPEVHALVDVRVVTAPGEVLENATIVIRDGLIEAVGTDISIPADARLIEFERGEEQPPITVYPGLIESYLPVTFEADEDAETPSGRHSLINPDRVINAARWPTESIEALRRAGFTTALIAPEGGLLAGQSTLANLGDGGLSANRISGPMTQNGSLHGRDAEGGYPQSLMGTISLMRQTLADARWQAQAQSAWARNPAQARPQWIEGLDSLAAVFAGDMPLVMTSEDALDTLRVYDMIDREIKLVMVGNGSEYQRLASIAERGAPHILPLNFPAAPDVEETDDSDNNSDNNRDNNRDGNLNSDVALEDLRHWHMAPENPARLMAAGVPVLFTSHESANPTDLFGAIATAIERGLDPVDALAALTTGPAEWLGIADRAGKIAPGYMANLLLVEGELLVESPTISEVWVDGHRFELAALEPPEVDPAGTWNLVINAGGMGDIDGVLKLSGPATGMQGSLTLMGTEAPLSEARVSGKQLQIKFDAANFGAAGTISVNLDIEGDRGRGSGSGPFGEFTLRGERASANPDEEVQR